MLRIAVILLSTIWLTSASHADGGPTGAPNYTQVPLLGGTRTLRKNHWSLISFEVGNPTSHSVELLTTSFFVQAPQRQYGSALWVPPQAKRRGWFPILAPASLSDSTRTVEFHSFLIDRTGGAETILPGSHGTLTRHGMLGVTSARVTTGIMQDPLDEAPRHAITAARTARNLTTSVPGLEDESLPPLETVVNGLDQLVISNDALLRDGAALTAVRQWLHGGGRAWIMLDKVSPTLVHQLLGNRFSWEAVDHVLLDTAELLPAQPQPGERDSLARTFDEPLDFLRIVVPNGDVSYSIGGWPAATWCSVGRGEVLFTTLEARGWYREWAPDDHQPKDVLKRSSFTATEPLKRLAERFLQPRETPIKVRNAFDRIVSEELGHAILPFRLAALILGGFCATLVVLTLILVRFGRIAILGVLSPVLALLAAGILATAGAVSHQATPQSMAIGQHIEVDASFSTLRASGVVSLYNQQAWEAPTGCDTSGLFMPRTGEATGSTVRMVWTDLNHWRWENLTLPSGVQTGLFSCSISVDTPATASATLNQEGIVLDFDPGSLGAVSDVLLLAPDRRAMQTHRQADGTLLACFSDLLLPGQYATGTLISGTTRRRQTALRNLLTSDGLWPSNDLVLLGWAEPVDLPFVLNDPEHRAGSALVTVPVRLSRPAAGTRVAIPSSLVQYRTTAGDRGTISPAYSNQDRKWVDQLVTATRAKLRIDLPSVLLPVEVDHLTVTLNIVAPQREVKILGKNTNSNDQKDVILWRTESPVGTTRIAIEPDTPWQVVEPGDLTLTLSVGEHPHQEGGANAKAGWQIDDLSLDVTGTILAR